MSSKDLKMRFESQFWRMNCQIFSWLELGCARWQRQERDVARNPEIFRAVPAGLIEDENGMRRGRPAGRDGAHGATLDAPEMTGMCLSERVAMAAEDVRHLSLSKIRSGRIGDAIRPRLAGTECARRPEQRAGSGHPCSVISVCAPR
jgi:hypothetical protein